VPEVWRIKAASGNTSRIGESEEGLIPTISKALPAVSFEEHAIQFILASANSRDFSASDKFGATGIATHPA
jgi:hypothetical protein